MAIQNKTDDSKIILKSYRYLNSTDFKYSK